MLPRIGPLELVILLVAIGIIIVIVDVVRRSIKGGGNRPSQVQVTVDTEENPQTSNVFSRLLSPFGLVVIVCFFLPWITVSCGGEPVVNQVTGAQIANPMNVAGQQTEGVRELYLVLAGGVIIALLGAALWTRPNQLASGICLISALVIGWIVFSFWQRAQNMLEQDQFAASFITIDWEIGFWGTVIASISSAIAAIVSFAQRR